MKLWMAYATLGFSVALILALGFAGCQWGTPTEGPRVDARGNTGTVVTNITNGSNSPVGTAPCGATANQKNGDNRPGGPDCSTSTDDHSVPLGGAI